MFDSMEKYTVNQKFLESLWTLWPFHITQLVCFLRFSATLLLYILYRWPLISRFLFWGLFWMCYVSESYRNGWNFFKFGLMTTHLILLKILWLEFDIFQFFNFDYHLEIKTPLFLKGLCLFCFIANRWF